MNNIKNSAINLSSFFVTSLIALYLYYFLVKIGNEELLGLFNLQYIFIIIFSQLGTFGVHYSILRQTSIKNSSYENFDNLFAGLLLVLINSIIVCFFATLFFENFPNLIYFNFNNLVYPITLFALNKCIYWFLNGKEKYLRMAFASPIRMATYLITINYLYESSNITGNIYIAFLIGEMAVFLYQLIFSANLLRVNTDFRTTNDFIRTHLKYGKDAFLTSFLSDVNLKIDLITISYILGSKFVGLYSFTSALGEGYIGLLTVVRTISTPKLNELLENPKEFKNYRKSIFFISYSIAITAGLSILIMSKFFGSSISFLSDINTYGYTSLLIIIFGFMLISYCFAFEHILLQTGFPKDHTKCLLTLFFVNILLNVILINFIGLNGAALATILSYLIYFLTINKRAKRLLNNGFIKSI